MPEDIIRLCVGIEDPEDLLDDLSRAVSFALSKSFIPSLTCVQLVQAGAVNITTEGFQALAAEAPASSQPTEAPAPAESQTSVPISHRCSACLVD